MTLFLKIKTGLLKVVTKQSVIIFSRLSVTYLCKYGLLVGTSSAVLQENRRMNAEHWENDRLPDKTIDLGGICISPTATMFTSNATGTAPGSNPEYWVEKLEFNRVK